MICVSLALFCVSDFCSNDSLTRDNNNYNSEMHAARPPVQVQLKHKLCLASGSGDEDSPDNAAVWAVLFVCVCVCVCVRVFATLQTDPDVAQM